MLSMKESAVIFVDVEETYSYNEDLICKFVLNHYTPQDGDRIALYKLGWKSVKDYVVFEWAPVGIPESIEHLVVFEKQYLPRNESEIYQICYISSENILHGATIPFQFQEDPPKNQMISLKSCNSSEYKTPLLLSSFEDIMKLRRIRKENERNSANSSPSKKSYNSFESLDNHSNCEKEIAALKLEIEDLKKKLWLQQHELKCLKKNHQNSQKSLVFIKDLKYDLGELEPIPPFPLKI